MKKMLSLALALLMVLSLAACGGSGGNAPSSSGGSATGSGGAGADGDKPYAGTTISVVVCTSAFMDQLISDIPEFEEATGINVQIEQLQDAQVSQRVSVTCAGQSGDIDVFGYRPLQDSTLYINNGWLEDLSSYIEEAGDEFDYEDFFQASRDATSDADGTPYGIPYMTEREVVYLKMRPAGSGRLHRGAQDHGRAAGDVRGAERS